MAVETKIGLVVGLAFIVCFGVILSHRGSGDRLSTDVALDLLNRQRASAADVQPPRFDTITRRNPGDSRTISALPNRNVPTERPPAMPRGDTGVNRVDTATAPGGSAERTPNRVARGGGRVTEAPPTVPSSSGEDAAHPLYESLFGGDEPADEPEGPQEAVKPLTPKPAATPATRPPGRRKLSEPEQPRRYVVKQGDTLWAIAERLYGTRSKALVEALFAANRGEMGSADALRVGMRLTIPPAGNVAAPAVGQRVSARGQRVTGPVRFYQVQSGDRYTTIAARLLGEKRRWKELYELNKDIFPDAGRIRPGVRIRLPATVLADAG